MNPSQIELRYPIALFSAAHLSFLAVLIPLSFILAFFIAKKYGFSKTIIWVCAFLALFCEIERIIFYMEEIPGGFRLPANHIPLNLCPFQVILIFILALSEHPEKKRKLLSFMFPMMVGGGFIGMLLPGEALADHGLLELSTYRYFFFHGLVMFSGFYLYLSKPFEYGIKEYGTGLLLAFFALILGVYVNGFFGWNHEANHMFVVRPPAQGLPILNLDHGWPRYIFDMMVIGVFLITLCYLPVIIKSIKNRRKQKA